MKKIFRMIIILLLAASAGCGDSGNTGNSSKRLFRMGFTTWPYAAGADHDGLYAQENTYSLVKNTSNGDIVALHYMDGVPWDLCDDQLYPPGDVESVYASTTLDETINDRIVKTAPAGALYIALDTLNGSRNDIINSYSGSAPGFSFDDDRAKYSFVNYAVYVLYRVYAYYNSQGYDLPRVYLNYGTEVSELILNGFNTADHTFDTARWDAFKNFAGFVFDSLDDYTLPDGTDDPDFNSFIRSATLMVSVALKSPKDDIDNNTWEGTVAPFSLKDRSEQLCLKFGEITGYIDMVGISTYGYIFYDDQYGAVNPDTYRGNPDNMPQNWLSQIRDIAPGKPYAITETGWISSDYDATYDGSSFPGTYVIRSTPAMQSRYVDMMCNAMTDLNGEFIIWFSIADYDPLWDYLSQPDAKIVSLIWRNTGLLDVAPETHSEYQAGSVILTDKTGMSTWRSWLEKTYSR